MTEWKTENVRKMIFIISLELEQFPRNKNNFTMIDQ